MTEGKLTKEELRDDPVVDAFMRAVTIVRQRATIIMVVLGLIAVGLVATQLVRQSGERAEKDAALKLLDGEGQYQSGNVAEALRLFLSGAETFKGSPSGKLAGLRAADCQLEMGQTAEAMRLYQKFLDSRPKDDLLRASALRGLAKSLESSGKGEEAVKKFEEAAAIQASPMRADDLVSAAQIHLEAGRLAEAKALYQKVYDLFPGSLRVREAKEGLDRIRARQGS